MSKITVYEKPTCSTCRKVHAALVESGVDFDKVDYYVEPIAKEKLQSLLKKMKISADELIRKKEDLYKEHAEGKDLDEDALVNLMVQYPDLIQRPIIEKGDRAILARPAEKLQEIL